MSYREMSGDPDTPLYPREELDEWLDSDPSYQEWSETIELENRRQQELDDDRHTQSPE